MATEWTGTVEERYERLERADRRCDGNNLRCVNAATVSYDLAPARNWEEIPGAEWIRKKACSRHVQQFINNERYVVKGSRRLENRRSNGAAHPYTLY